MNSRWQANKIGLINFWYYDEQEFSFVKGRLLLRGSNGSGKSVTMQSVVPLLLDGNMSPERLDPFGSRDRKMSSYLLEEDDSREERTGYLYLEFRRQKSETYLTVGMGIRARKGKPLDKWYFSLTDGRRIGKDFFLYKKTDEKVTLSKKELENRIQGGGFVFDRQADYMEYVNRQIFGFETLEEYKEMIDLLIQLRTPKLSKDFKPSVINEILSDSLQPLSDEDLRPMSEAIENMDAMNMNLKTRQEALQAATKVGQVWEQYNRLELYEKAAVYEKNQSQLLELQRQMQTMEKEIQDCDRQIAELTTEHADLEARREAMEKEKESLSKSDAVGLKDREVRLRSQIEAEEQHLADKNRQLDDKKEQYLEQELKRKQAEDSRYEKEKELKDLLSDMEAEAADMSFEEHTFFADEWQEGMEEVFAFDVQEEQMKKTAQDINHGVKLWREAEEKRRQADEQLKLKEQNGRKMDAAWKKGAELESLLAQALNEWREALYTWNGGNLELKLTKDQLVQAAAFADQYDEHADYGSVRQVAHAALLEQKGQLQLLLQQAQDQFREIQGRHEEIQIELNEWENHKEPVPERSAEVIRNRQRLQQEQIPYQEFYKVIEFGPDLDQTSCDRLEEALLYMGILDALIIEDTYRERVLALDPGSCDKYLFVQNHRTEKSVLDVLELNDSVNDIFFNQRITSVLGNIAYDGEGDTSISPDGTYQIGVVTGTITGEYEAGYLGTRAREKNRLDRIENCKKDLKILNEQIYELDMQIGEYKRRDALLQTEYEGLPGDEDIRTAYRMYREAKEEETRLREEGKRLESRLNELTKQFQEINRRALEAADRLYIPGNYEAFLRADEAAADYRQHFYQLKSGHELYLQILVQLEDLMDRMEKLDIDLEEIRYEIGTVTRTLKQEKEEYVSVLEQLKLTDYEEIRERLDACVEWLAAYPGKLEKCVQEASSQRNRKGNLQEKNQQLEGQLAKNQEQDAYLKLCFEAELELGYVTKEEEDAPDGIQITVTEPGKVRGMLEADCKALIKESVLTELNRVYFENRAFLNEYQLTQSELFTEMEAADAEVRAGIPSARRLDMTARYQGVKIPFHKLIAHLREDIEELKELIKAGDRELFEDILANTVSRKIRGKINNSTAWVEKMNILMGSMNTSSGLKLSLHWRSRTAETEDQLDTRELVKLLKKDYRLMREEEASRLSLHFRSKVEEARRHAKDTGGMISFYQVMKETLDYRKWFEFQLFSQKSGEKSKELTNSVFGTFSGGEKAMSMYVPLFSAVVAKYQGGREDAPRLISLDEAFAGVDNKNIRDMFRLMTEFQFDFILNSQVLWGDCDTLDALAIYQLLRPGNAKFVTVMPYLWNGKVKEFLEDEKEMEDRCADYAGMGM